MATFRDINYNTRIDADLLVTGSLTVDGDIIGIDLNNYYTKSDLNTSAGIGEVHWDNITSAPVFDNYSSWSIGDGVTFDAVTSGQSVSIIGSGSTVISRTNIRELTVSSTDTTYSAGDGISLSGSIFSVDLDIDSGLTLATSGLSNSDKGSSQNIFKNININGTILSASSNNDSFSITGTNAISASLSGNIITINHIDSDHTTLARLVASNTFTSTQNSIILKPSSSPNTLLSNEAVVFTTDTQYLINTPMDSMSEQVKSDTLGTVVYQRDVDYNIDYFTGEISRIAEGSIAESSTVYVDYTATKSLMKVQSYDGANTYFSLDSMGNIFGKSLTVNLSSSNESSDSNIQGAFNIEGNLNVNGSTTLGDDATEDSVAVKGEFSVYDSVSAVFRVDTTGTMTIGTVPWARLSNIPLSSTTNSGIVQLSDSTSSTSTSIGATANAVKKAYDLAASKWTYSEATIKAVKVNSAIDADTVSGFTVGTNVPQDAVFTDNDTVYEHPITHPPSIIAQDSTNKFVTDSQISSWDSKAGGVHSHIKTDITDFAHTHPSEDISGLPDFSTFFLKSGGQLSGNISFSQDNASINLAGGTTSSKNRLVIGEQGLYGVGFEWDGVDSLDFISFNNSDVTLAPTSTYGSINITTGAFDWTGPLQQNGVDVSLSNHTHGYLSDSGGILSGALTIKEDTLYPLTVSYDSVESDEIGINFVSRSTEDGYIKVDSTDSHNANYKFRMGSPGRATSLILDGGGNFYVDNYPVWHENNFNPSNYLPISGGELTGNLSMKNYSITNINSISVASTSRVANLNANYLEGYTSSDIYNDIINVSGFGLISGCRVSQLTTATDAVKITSGVAYIKNYGTLTIPSIDAQSGFAAGEYHVVYIDGDNTIGAIGVERGLSDYPDMSAFPNHIPLAKVYLPVGVTSVSDSRIFSIRDLVPLQSDTRYKTVDILKVDDLNRAVSTSTLSTVSAQFKSSAGRATLKISDVPTGTGVKKSILIETDKISFNVDSSEENITATKIPVWDEAGQKKHLHFYDAETNAPTNSNTTYSITAGHVLSPDTTRVYKNGLRQKYGLALDGGDYTINNSSIVFNVAPLLEDNVIIDYDM